MESKQSPVQQQQQQQQQQQEDDHMAQSLGTLDMKEEAMPILESCGLSDSVDVAGIFGSRPMTQPELPTIMTSRERKKHLVDPSLYFGASFCDVLKGCYADTTNLQEKRRTPHVIMFSGNGIQSTVSPAPAESSSSSLTSLPKAMPLPSAAFAVVIPWRDKCHILFKSTSDVHQFFQSLAKEYRVNEDRLAAIKTSQKTWFRERGDIKNTASAVLQVMATRQTLPSGHKGPSAVSRAGKFNQTTTLALASFGGAQGYWTLERKTITPLAFNTIKSTTPPPAIWEQCIHHALLDMKLASDDDTAKRIALTIRNTALTEWGKQQQQQQQQSSIFTPSTKPVAKVMEVCKFTKSKPPRSAKALLHASFPSTFTFPPNAAEQLAKLNLGMYS